MQVQPEFDAAAFAASAKFCVYLHKRPDGTVFYVGKGVKARAHDFSPSRRGLWHRNVVAKYGREAIGVQVIPCITEAEALILERTHIGLLRANGADLVNLTDGGEGCTGRPPTEAQLAGLAKGRRKGKPGRSGPFPELATWRESEAAHTHRQALGQAGAQRLHALRVVNCCECGCDFETRSAKAKACSRKCEQRHRRAKDKQ